MKKIAILSAVNIRHMSLISLYTNYLKTHGFEYDIIYMDKYDEIEDFDCKNRYRYVNVIKPKWPAMLKAVKYMSYVPWAKKILNREKYDFIIVWNDLAIFMFADYLAKYYKGKYCLNVRDNMSYEKKILKKRYEKCFENSVFNTIPSKGYLDLLPSNVNYLQINSLNLAVLSDMKIRTEMQSFDRPIRIGFIGYVRYFERNQRMLDVFANDSRFELAYYGTHANVLKEYADKHNIRNAVFHDTFSVSETGKFLEKIDIINNLYGNDTLNVQRAISIKYFHSLYCRLPILVCPNTYVGHLSVENGIGFYVDDINIEMKEKIYHWYQNLSFENIEKICTNLINSAIYENKKLDKKLDTYLEY